MQANLSREAVTKTALALAAFHGAAHRSQAAVRAHLGKSLARACAHALGLTLSRKMTVFYGGLLTFALGLVLVGSYLGIGIVADHILGREFAAESRVFERLREMRYDQMQHGAELLAADYGFRGAVAIGEAPTIRSALENLKRRMRVSDAMFIDTNGNLIGLRETVSKADLSYLVDAVNRDATRGVLRLGAHYFGAVAAPVNAPALVGWVVFLDPLGRREMARLAGVSATPLRAEIMARDRVERDIPIVTAGSEVRAERSDGGERMLVQASIVADFGGGRPQVLVLEYSLSQALAAYAPMFRILFASCIVALVIAIAGSLYLARKLGRPIEALGRAAERVSLGEFTHVDVVGDDEIARLTRAFNTMVCDIRDRERQVAQAQSRLEIEIRDVQAENARLDAIAARQRGSAMAEAARALETQLAPLILTFDSEAGRLFVAAREMRTGLQQTKTQAAEAGQSAQRTENMTHMIADNAGGLAKSGERIAGEAGSTLDLVRQAAQDSATATASFAGLRHAVSEIGNVTGEIRAISGRTNMLAINAAIEAARAGPAGRSFAIVASEVKDLARRTAALTAAIGNRLDQVEQAAIDADGTLGQVRGTLAVAAGVTGMIASAARDQSDATGSISEGISDIAGDSRAAVAAIGRIGEAAAASVQMADQVQSSAETVAARARLLRRTVDEFLVTLRQSSGCVTAPKP